MKKVVLLVEDNQDNRTIYRTILEFVGYGVAEAADGEDAIRLTRETLPDLILMDISIPVVDGWEATRRLKADAQTRHIPIVALTAHALAADRAKAEEIGCDGYLAKPVEPRRVVEEVDRFSVRAPRRKRPALTPPSRNRSPGCRLRAHTPPGWHRGWRSGAGTTRNSCTGMI